MSGRALQIFWGGAAGVLVGLLFSVAPSCGLVAGVDELSTKGSCESAGAKECIDNRPEECGADGRWKALAPRCADSTCDPTTLTCVGECELGARRCAGLTPEECDASGQWAAEASPCATGCAEGVCLGPCSPGDLRCDGEQPQVCGSGGSWQNVEACQPCFGCDENTGTCSTKPEGECATPTAVAAGWYHSCALFKEGDVKCWGRNLEGELGIGSLDNRGDDLGEMGTKLPYIDLGVGQAAARVVAGSVHTCALLEAGAVKCWGANSYGQLGLGLSVSTILGDGEGEMGELLPAVDLGLDEVVVSLAAGGYHTCALLETGAVKCWGRNHVGQLGLGDIENRGDSQGEMGANLAAVDLGPGEMATAITAGQYHTCALLSGGRVKCWGENSYGQLGLGSTDARGDEALEMGSALGTIDLGQDEAALAISAGDNHTCALLAGGFVKCWGQNDEGQLGMGDNQNIGDGPGEMGGILPVIDLGAGAIATAIATGGAHSCALLSDGEMKCWGKNESGQLGLGHTDSVGDDPSELEMGDKLPAVPLGSGEAVKAMSAGQSHTCALLLSEKVKCWGANELGQLGLGPEGDQGDEAGEMGASLSPVDL